MLQQTLAERDRTLQDTCPALAASERWVETTETAWESQKSENLRLDREVQRWKARARDAEKSLKLEIAQENIGHDGRGAVIDAIVNKEPQRQIGHEVRYATTDFKKRQTQQQIRREESASGEDFYNNAVADLRTATNCAWSLLEEEKNEALNLEVETNDKETEEEEGSSEKAGTTQKRNAYDAGTQTSNDMLSQDEEHVLVMGVVQESTTVVGVCRTGRLMVEAHRC